MDHNTYMIGAKKHMSFSLHDKRFCCRHQMAPILENPVLTQLVLTPNLLHYWYLGNNASMALVLVSTFEG